MKNKSFKPDHSIDGIQSRSNRRRLYIEKPVRSLQPKQIVSFRPTVHSMDILPPKRPLGRTSQSSTDPALHLSPIQSQKSRLDLAHSEIVVKLPRKRVFYGRVSSIIQYLLIAVAAAVAAGNSTIGQFIVLAYGLYALILRKDSQPTFVIALILLVSIPVFQFLKQSGVAENMAVYTYELLVVGTLQAIVELKFPKRKEAGV